MKWSGPTAIDSNLDLDLESVSCPSSSFCMAIDGGGHAVQFNGSGWSQPSSVDDGGPVEPDSVSCPTSAFCATVYGDGVALTYNGSSWSQPHQIDTSGYSPGAVSCATSDFCLAPTGRKGKVMCPTSPKCMTAAAGARQRRSPTSRPGAPCSSATAWCGVHSVSCVSTTFCVGLAGGGPSDAGQGYALTYDGSSWSQPSPMDSGGGGRLTLSCASSNFCVAADWDGNVATYDGSMWSHPVHIDNGEWGLDSVSCPSSSFCAAADPDGTVYTSTNPAS